MRHIPRAIEVFIRQYLSILKRYFLINMVFWVLGFVCSDLAKADEVYDTINEAVADDETTDKTYTLSEDETITSSLGDLQGTSLTINADTHNITSTSQFGVKIVTDQQLNINNAQNVSGFSRVIDNQGGVVYISSSNFNNNSITNDWAAYAAVFANAGSGYISGINGITFNNNTLHSNNANANGVIIDNYGGIVDNIVNTTFTNNKASSEVSYVYGGLFSNNWDGVFGNINGTFTNNGVQTYGNNTNANGGIMDNAGGSIGNISGTFTGNYALSWRNLADTDYTNSWTYGGVLSNSGNVGNISGKYDANYAKSYNARSYGGVIHNAGTIAGVTGTYTNNYVYSELRYAYGGVINNDGTITNGISGTFTDNYVYVGDGKSAEGGVIRNSGTIGNMSGTFERNYVSTLSADIEWGQAEGGVINNTRSIGSINNSEELGKFADNYALSNVGQARGGAIFNSGENARINGIYDNFTRNYALSLRGYAAGGAIYNTSGAQINNKILGTFTSNHAVAGADETGALYAYGGAIANVEAAVINEIEANFSSNYALSYSQGVTGGAIDNTGTIGDVNESKQNGKFENNYVKSLSADKQQGSAQGGAINNSGIIGNIGSEDYKQSFTGNYAEANESFARGGAIHNANNGTKIGNIVADFSGNYVKTNGWYAEGGAINNHASAIIDGLQGNFSYNSAISVNGSVTGGAIYNSGKISEDDVIISSFTGNYASSANNYAGGGAIANNGGTMGDISGNFTANYVYSGELWAYGGAIANAANGVIGDINGNFSNNAVITDVNYDVTGGAIDNLGTIKGLGNNGTVAYVYSGNNLITTGTGSGKGGFLNNSGVVGQIGSSSYKAAFNSNYVSSINGFAQGGAIYNSNNTIGGTDENAGIYANFINNYAVTQDGVSIGGAIVNNGGSLVNVVGDFTGNYAESVNSNAYGGAIFNGSFNEIPVYNENSVINLSGNVFTNNYIKMGDTVIPNSIYNAGIININEGSTITVNDGWQSHAEGQIVMGSGSILNLNIANNVVQNDSLGIITNIGTINAAVDIDVNNGAIDTIGVTSDTDDGVINLSDINIFNGNAVDIAGQKLQILDTQDSKLKLSLADSLQTLSVVSSGATGNVQTTYEAIAASTDWDDMYKKYIANEYSTIYGKYSLSTTSTEDDSIVLTVTDASTTYDDPVESGFADNTLKLVNQSDIDERSFTTANASKVYTVVSDLGATGLGTFMISGAKSGDDISTIALNDKSGFELGEGTRLDLNTIKITSDSAIATVKNNDVVINLINASVNGDITADNEVDSYTLGLSGNNIIDGTVDKATIGLSSGTLTVGSNTLQNAALNASGGTVILSGDGVKNYQIGTLTSTGDAAYNIDFDVTDIDEPMADTVTAIGSGTVKLGLLNISGNISDIPEDLTDKTFIVQILKDSSAELQLDLSDDVKSQLGDTNYVIGGTTHNRDDVVGAVNTWKTEYKHKTQDEIYYGKMGLAKTVNENDSIGVTFDHGDLQDVVVVGSLGDTLSLVNQVESSDDKAFNATEDKNHYDVGADLGETKGSLTINGLENAETISTIDFGGTYKAFEKIDTGAEVNLNNVKLTNANGDIANVVGGKLTAENTEIDGTITNAGMVELASSYVAGAIANSGNITLTESSIGDISNSGTLDINDGVTTGVITGSGTTNINVDMELTKSIYGNTVNVNNSKLTGVNKLSNDVALNAKNATIDIGANTINIKSANLDSSSTLALRINGFADGEHGQLNASDLITISNGAKLKATLAQNVGLGDVTLLTAPAHNGDFANNDVSHVEDGVEIAENNMYRFKKTNTFGVYSVAQKAGAQEVVEEIGGENWVSNAAGAWVDNGGFAENSVAADVADKLADLAQNDAVGLVDAIKTLSPTEIAVVQTQSTEEANRLFKSVESFLRGEHSPAGFASGDALKGVSVWGKTYVGESKVSQHGTITGSEADSKGIIVGIEKRLNRCYKVGAGVQYDQTNISSYHRKIDTDSVMGFVYGEYKPRNWFINSIISYGGSNYDEKKYALGTHYDAKYDVHIASIAAMTGYQFKYFTPEMGLRYYNIKQQGYTDTAGQTIDGDKSDILRGVIGMMVSKSFGIFKPEAYLGITYDLASDKGNTTVNLANGTSYMVPGKRLDKLGYETSVGLAANLSNNIIASLNYIGAYRKHYQEHTGMLNVKYSF